MNLVVPGPMQSPQRALTHPGEDKHRLATAEQLLPAYLYLLGPDGKSVSGCAIELQTKL